jgi:beta-galactosidase/beta-glucuronidase
VSTLRLELLDAGGGAVAVDGASVTSFPGQSVTLRQRLFVADPHRWRLDDPYLYTCRATLLDGDDPLDTEESTFGIRSLALDPRRGLRVNGEAVVLRGACVHHDNGPLGAAAIGRADERRVERLEAAGFNAIRSAHNPMSRAMLDACDRLGVLVMDEAFDMWAQPKSEDDYARRFQDWWETDIEAMVRHAHNHPCVVLYSIGNEIPDGSTATGLQIGRALADKVRSLDDSRYVTQAVTGLLVGGAELFADMRETAAAARSTRRPVSTRPLPTSATSCATSSARRSSTTGRSKRSPRSTSPATTTWRAATASMRSCTPDASSWAPRLTRRRSPRDGRWWPSCPT